MINDYTCPRCHNVFPSSNKMLHEFRCTAENPVPLNESRMVIQNELENKQNNQNNNENNNNNPEIKNNENIIPPIPQIPQMPPPIEDNFKNLNINELFNLNNKPKEFFCVICKKNIDEKDKVDHLLCHNLANEQENEINNNGNIRNNGNNGNNNINDLYGFSQKEIEEQRKIERQIEKNKRKNQQNQNIRRNDFNNRNNNIRNDNINNNHIRPNLNIRRPNTNNSNNNNNTINNNHRNYQNNRSNINSNQQNRGPVITIRQTGQNGNTITTRFFQDIDIDFSSGPRMNFISNRIRTNNNNNNNNNNHRRGDFNVFNQFRNEFAEILNNGHQHHQHNQHQRTDRQLFNEFPETKIDDVDKLDPEKRNCIICLEDFKSGEKATLLPCVHLFHKNCINRWLTTKDFCPICKFELTRDNINRQNSNF